MLATLTDGPLLWFLNRGTGLVLLVVLSLTLTLGILSAAGTAGKRIPAFVSQNLHRNLSILGLALVLAHAITAVVDSYVDIRWWQALSPWGASYEPLWLGAGTLAFDLMLVVALSTAAKGRLSSGAWHRVHLLGYAAWPVAFAHGAGIGTDAGEDWTRWLGAACLALVLVAGAYRLTWGRRPRPVAAVLLPAARRSVN